MAIWLRSNSAIRSREWTASRKIAYTLLGFVSLLYLVVMVAGLIAAFPWGIVGLIAIVGIGLLLIKVIRERIRNREDDYYSKNVDQ